ncbi:MAG: response regulator [Terriglobia bacterium]
MLGQLNGRILLVEDDPLVRKFISGYLVAAGYVVRAAVDGLDAIAKLRAGPPDIFVSDINMPRRSGVEFLDVVRKRFPQIPVVVISAVTPDEVSEGMAADAYIHKDGFVLERLLQTITDLTRNPPPRSSPQHADHKLVQAIWDKDGHYIIGCDDCFRTFRIPRGTIMERSEKWTACVHCGRVVHFFVADGDLPEPPRL